MDIKDKVIDVFENRIMQLITITNITKLPQWDDADVLGAECLLKEYRRITSAMHSDGEEPGQFNVRLKTSELPKWKPTSKF